MSSSFGTSVHVSTRISLPDGILMLFPLALAPIISMLLAAGSVSVICLFPSVFDSCKRVHSVNRICRPFCVFCMFGSLFFWLCRFQMSIRLGRI